MASDVEPHLSEVLERLRAAADPTRLEGMARYGIRTDDALGVTVTELRQLARPYRRDHGLAESLWVTGIHEARILASIVEDPEQVTEAQMEAWVADFDSWDLCDQVCANLFDRTPSAFDKAIEWSARSEPFVRRAGLALMACLAVHAKNEPDERFERLLPSIAAAATDERNPVRKATSWALRQIGKRGPHLHQRAIATAEQIGAVEDRSARWVARDVLRELRSQRVVERLSRD